MTRAILSRDFVVGRRSSVVSPRPLAVPPQHAQKQRALGAPVGPWPLAGKASFNYRARLGRCGWLSVLLVLLLVAGYAAAQTAQSNVSDSEIQRDPVLRAMSEELQRSKDQLKLDQM